MTPGARLAAAIEILDLMADGLAAEHALSRWSRESRYAGSGDRAAVRDHVFDALRMRRSAAWLGGAETGRGLMIGLLRIKGESPAGYFTGEGHAPAPLEPHETAVVAGPMPEAVAWNLPDWLMPLFRHGLGADAARTALALQERAPVTLRVNTARTTAEAAIARLLSDGIHTRGNSRAATALTVERGARKVRNSAAFRAGEVELQDAASQAVVARLPPFGRALDYCAGGGGKALALAMRREGTVFAHDANPDRMADLPNRARRAGADIPCLAGTQVEAQAPFDLVLCDAPCSGSGTWRRAPEAKWALTQDRLGGLMRIQDDILRKASALTAPEGTLAYVTCSVLTQENEHRVNSFLEDTPGWVCTRMRRCPVDEHGDGFFTAHLTRAK